MNWYNSIIYGNTAPTGSNYAYLQPPIYDVPWHSCCTSPLPTVGESNFTNDPGFVDLAGGDFHLQSNSSCINAGNKLSFTAKPAPILTGIPVLPAPTWMPALTSFNRRLP